jgi:hypothetical protein
MELPVVELRPTQRMQAELASSWYGVRAFDSA